MNFLNQEQLSKHFKQIQKAKNLAASKVFKEEGDGHERQKKHKLYDVNIDFTPFLFHTSEEFGFKLPNFGENKNNPTQIA